MIKADQDLGRIKTSSLLGFIFSPYPSNEVSGSPHFYSNNATLGSILDIQLSRKSGKFQLARWRNEVAIFPVRGGASEAEIKYCASAASMLAEEIWQIAEGFVEVPVNLLVQLKKCGKNIPND